MHESSKIDREKTCPFLLRVFLQHGRHNRPEKFECIRDLEQVLVHTWKDATLLELLGLISEKYPEALTSKCSFRLVYLNKLRREFEYKEVGCFSVGNPGRDATRTLDDIRFIIGDYIDIALYK